ncbi:hypothetical protein RC95_13665 [Pectobacterium brasiliense]|nr:hypothetical protein RC95_13665 [Pectobacterium brasiliense]
MAILKTMERMFPHINGHQKTQHNIIISVLKVITIHIQIHMEPKKQLTDFLKVALSTERHFHIHN